MKISVLWYGPDNWYGSNYRVVVNGFETKKEIAPYKAKLKKYIADKYKVKIKQSDIIISDDDEELVTYKYCSIGPSWTCSNIEVSKTALKKF